MSTSALKSASDSSPTSASESMACSSVPSPSRRRTKQSLPVLRRKITRPVDRDLLAGVGVRLELRLEGRRTSRGSRRGVWVRSTVTG